MAGLTREQLVYMVRRQAAWPARLQVSLLKAGKPSSPFLLVLSPPWPLALPPCPLFLQAKLAEEAERYEDMVRAG